MAISPISAATTVCTLLKWQVTDMDLHKILYLAHMVYMGRTGKPLLDEGFCAWAGGPYIPSLRNHNRVFGARAVSQLPPVQRNMDLPEQACLVEMAHHLAKASPAQLVALTHRAGGGWDSAWVEDSDFMTIPDSAILAEYDRYHRGGATPPLVLD